MTSRNEDGEVNRCLSCKRVLMVKDGRDYCFYCETIKAEDEKLAKEVETAFDKMQIKKQIDKFKKYSLINAKLQSATFENYKPQNREQAEAKERALAYALEFNLDDPTPLFLYGPYGTGKSHLAKSITDIVMEKDKTCLFFTVEKLMAKIKSTWRDSDMTEFQFMELLAKVDLLVLDDLGAERNTTRETDISWSTAMFFSIVNSRAGKHTVLTMNFTIPQMLKVYGERDGSRLIEDAKLIAVPGENYRLRQFKKGNGNP